MTIRVINSIIIIGDIMKIIKKENSCPCCYCEHYIQLIDKSFYFPDHKGLCNKHKVIRLKYDNLCEDFILISGIHTDKWYPNKKGLED